MGQVGMKKTPSILVFVALIALLALTACAPYWGPGGGGGMMGGQGGGTMGPGGSGGMMGGGSSNYNPGTATALSHEDAEQVAAWYLASINDPGLEINEFEEYSSNFYVSFIETGTGRGAIEIIIDRYYGSYRPEPQTMMWNGKYGMMGSFRQGPMTVSADKALRIAQDFIDVAYPGTEAEEIITYYGYYTIMTELEGEHYGMLSVNGYSGGVWYHSWHGRFITEVKEQEEHA